MTPLVSGSAVSVSATVAPPRAIAKVGGLYSNSQLQGAMNARQQAVVDAARQHAKSYSKSAAKKKERVEVQRLQALMGKKALFEDPAIQGSPLREFEVTEMERLLHEKKLNRRATDAEKTAPEQSRGSKLKSPASVVKTLSGACVIFEKVDDDKLEEVGRVSDNILISVKDPHTPGSLPTALEAIVGKDIDIKEDWNRQNILECRSMAASGAALESLESIEAALRAGICLSRLFKGCYTHGWRSTIAVQLCTSLRRPHWPTTCT